MSLLQGLKVSTQKIPLMICNILWVNKTVSEHLLTHPKFTIPNMVTVCSLLAYPLIKFSDIKNMTKYII